jgi:hypothetical protein
MGIHLHVCTLTGEEYPAWDFARLGGDSDFVAELLTLENESNVSEALDSEVYRPRDVEAWRAIARRIDAEFNPGRLEGLVDILASDARYHVYISW